MPTDERSPGTPRPNVSLMIPALNEERRIGATLDTVLAVAARQPGLRLEILVVDDGSADNTAWIASDYANRHSSVRLIRHLVNRGLGQALRTALAEATGDKFLIVPGDNDLPASTLDTLLANAGAADMVMCFFQDRGQRGRTRQMLSSLFGLAYATCFDFRVQYINGPCLYPMARLRELSLTSTRFSIVAEINVKLLRQGLSFCELPSHRQTGLAGSSSFSLRNLAETIAVFCHLCYEVHFKSRAHYAHRPRRVMPVTTPPVQSIPL